MRKELAEITCCPVTKEPLVLNVEEEDDHGDVVKGTLYSKKLDFHYPIEDGIPNLLPPEFHVDGVPEKKGKKSK
ncbi:MAG: Trm112 family protein [Thermoplasmatota archaeon]